MTETVFCQSGRNVTYTCMHAPRGFVKLLLWEVDGTILNSFGLGSMVGDIAEDDNPSRGLTSTLTANDGTTLTMSLTIGPPNEGLIGTLIECRDNMGVVASTTTDTQSKGK